MKAQDNNFRFNPRYLLLGSFLFFLVMTILDVFQAYYYSQNYQEPFNWFQRLTHILPYFSILWLSTLPVYRYYRWTRPLSWTRRFIIHAGSSLIFGFIVVVLTMMVMNLVRNNFGTPEQQDREYWASVMNSIKMGLPFSINGMMMYWVMQLVFFALEFYEGYRNQYVRALTLESELMTAQLRTLKRQLQPHFLFNALNTIAMMVRRGKDEEAVEMISGLSDLLRSTLANQGDQLVPLREEIDLLKKYLKIEQVRFKDKLAVSFHLQPETLHIQVPNLILQPIVENAFKYGVSRSLEEAGISIVSNLSDNYLHLSVVNLGPALPPGWSLEHNKGIGLSNTLERLKQLYGDSYGFAVKNIHDAGVAVEIKIPLHIATK